MHMLTPFRLGLTPFSQQGLEVIVPSPFHVWIVKLLFLLMLPGHCVMAAFLPIRTGL